MSGLSSFFDYPGDDRQATRDVEPQLLPHWTERQWDTLLQFTDTIRFRGGQRVVQKGDVDRSLLIVGQGSLEVIMAAGLATRRHPLGPGSLIGEVAFFDGEPRSADVMAVSDGELLRLNEAGFEEFAARHPGLARELLMALGEVLAFRLRRTEQITLR